MLVLLELLKFVRRLQVKSTFPLASLHESSNLFHQNSRTDDPASFFNVKYVNAL